jgi:hypothetical protein
MDAIIQRANERYEFLAQDKETLRLYEMRQMGQMDWNNELYHATAEANRERDQERAARIKAERRIAELEAQLRAQ